tara:strand:+ start:18 stop:398 length:381 start_codon:yes stop_codon:yes gene_type:complete
MSLIAQARLDWKEITSNSNEFGVPIILINPTTLVEYSIVGLATKHHLGIDELGNEVITKNAHISFSEELVIALGGSIRDASGEVNLERWIVKYSDSTLSQKNYVITQFIPDETVGIIVCILSDYQI